MFVTVTCMHCIADMHVKYEVNVISHDNLQTISKKTW